MIKIAHTNCWYVRRKATILGCSQSFFHGTGVPLQVILHSFYGKDIIWFSIIYGDWNDNTLLIGMNPKSTNSLEKMAYTDVSPIGKSFGSQGVFEEYVLSPEVRKALSISLNWKNNDYSIANEKDILYQVYCHDDCYSAVKLTDGSLLQDLVNSVLQQHSYYLQIEVDWSSVLNTITKEVRASKSLVLKSNSTRQCLMIRQEGLWPFMKTILISKSSCAVIIDNKKASLSKNYLNKLKGKPEF